MIQGDSEETEETGDGSLSPFLNETGPARLVYQAKKAKANMILALIIYWTKK